MQDLERQCKKISVLRHSIQAGKVSARMQALQEELRLLESRLQVLSAHCSDKVYGLPYAEPQLKTALTEVNGAFCDLINQSLMTIAPGSEILVRRDGIFEQVQVQHCNVDPITKAGRALLQDGAAVEWMRLYHLEVDFDQRYFFTMTDNGVLPLNDTLTVQAYKMLCVANNATVLFKQ